MTAGEGACAFRAGYLKMPCIRCGSRPDRLPESGFLREINVEVVDGEKGSFRMYRLCAACAGPPEKLSAVEAAVDATTEANIRADLAAL